MNPKAFRSLTESANQVFLNEQFGGGTNRPLGVGGGVGGIGGGGGYGGSVPDRRGRPAPRAPIRQDEHGNFIRDWAPATPTPPTWLRDVDDPDIPGKKIPVSDDEWNRFKRNWERAYQDAQDWYDWLRDNPPMIGG